MENHTNDEIAKALDCEKIPKRSVRKTPSFFGTMAASAISIATAISVVVYARTELKGLFNNTTQTDTTTTRIEKVIPMQSYTATPYLLNTTVPHSMQELELRAIRQTTTTPDTITPATNIPKSINTYSPNIAQRKPMSTIVDSMITKAIYPKNTNTVLHTAPIITSTIEKRIAAYATENNGIFRDNTYFKGQRMDDALEELAQLKQPVTSQYVIVVNKTFQKAAIFKHQSGSSMPYYLVGEVNCSTAKIYGKKKYNGDGKTPEGVYPARDIRNGEELLFEGKRAYGPYVFTLLNRIWGHGNGSQLEGNPKTYQPPEPLGIHLQEKKGTLVYNFGYGRSHGCVRFDNAHMKMFIEHRIIEEGTPFVIFENKKMTQLLQQYYNARPTGESYATTRSHR